MAWPTGGATTDPIVEGEEDYIHLLRKALQDDVPLFKMISFVTFGRQIRKPYFSGPQKNTSAPGQRPASCLPRAEGRAVGGRSKPTV